MFITNHQLIKNTYTVVGNIVSEHSICDSINISKGRTLKIYIANSC